MKKFLSVLAVLLCILTAGSVFAGCSDATATATADNAEPDLTVQTEDIEEKVQSDIDIDLEDIEGSIDLSTAYKIRLADTGTTAEGGATVNGTKVKITAGGVYLITGSVSDGQIKVDLTDESESVVLVLNGASITNQSGAAIHIKNALSAYVVAYRGSKNSLADTADYTFSSDDTDGEPDATIFSKADLILGGGGSLSISANYSAGVKSKDHLVITGLTLSVTAVDDAIKGRDSVDILGGTIHVDAENDGIKTTNDQDDSLGDITVSGGSLSISAGTDGIQSERNLTITGGTFTITTGGGAASATKNSFGTWGSTSSSDSAKGIKAADTIAILGGTIHIDSADDAIHADNAITISGGTMELKSGDDGVHADATLTVSNGEVTVSKSYEGLESAVITVSGGHLEIKASDDGINAGGGNDSSNEGGLGGGDPFAVDTSAMIRFLGGYCYISADGDGFDSNGSAEMTGGTLIVDGPENAGNGALDVASAFTVSGGLLIAAGSSGMAQAPSSDSTQGVIQIETGAQSAGTIFNLQDSAGNSLITFAPSKSYSNVIVSSPDIKSGESYTIYTGGSCDGEKENGLYRGGTYTAGTKLKTVSMTATVVSDGGDQGNMGGMLNGMQGGQGNMQGGMQGGMQNSQGNLQNGRGNIQGGMNQSSAPY